MRAALLVEPSRDETGDRPDPAGVEPSNAIVRDASLRSNAWSEDELRRVGETQELEIAPVRRDGELRIRTPIWVGRHIRRPTMRVLEAAIFVLSPVRVAGSHPGPPTAPGPASPATPPSPGSGHGTTGSASGTA